ncbi:MAG: hypothetical protein ACAH88_10715, partial [Roseimicrobium sp.]
TRAAAETATAPASEAASEATATARGETTSAGLPASGRLGGGITSASANARSAKLTRERLSELTRRASALRAGKDRGENKDKAEGENDSRS